MSDKHGSQLRAWIRWEIAQSQVNSVLIFKDFYVAFFKRTSVLFLINWKYPVQTSGNPILNTTSPRWCQVNWYFACWGLTWKIFSDMTNIGKIFWDCARYFETRQNILRCDKIFWDWARYFETWQDIFRQGNVVLAHFKDHSYPRDFNCSPKSPASLYSSRLSFWFIQS